MSVGVDGRDELRCSLGRGPMNGNAGLPLPEPLVDELGEILLRGESDPWAKVDALASRHSAHAMAISRAAEELLGPRQSERFGDFVVQRRLGEGAYATVYLASGRGGSSDLVAVKVAKHKDDAAAQALRREARLLSRMQHPSIAALRDHGGECEHGAYFAMEYVEGAAITEYCAANRLSRRDRIAMFAAVCDGVAHAHQRGILHLDLKPEHILVSTIDGQPRPKIIDFGIADASDTPSVSREGQPGPGTLPYMAPEQQARHLFLRSGQRPDTRADVFALGVVLYELLFGDTTGVPTAEAGGSATDDLDLVRRRPADGRALGADLARILRCALARHPESRYGSVSELAQDLRDHLELRPLTGHPAGPGERAGKYVRRHWRRVLAGCAGLSAAAMVLTAWSHDQNVESQKAILRETERLFAEYDSLGPVHEESLARLRAWRDGVDSVRARVRLAPEPTRPTGLMALCERPIIIDGSGFPMWGIDRQIQALERVRADLGREWDRGWRDVMASLREDRRFDGVPVEPQSDLLPLGRDANSGLWQFWHMHSGERPGVERGRVLLGERTGIVMVLVPGGSFRMGLLYEYFDPDPAERPHLPLETRFREADADELPAHEVQVDAFLISKYELTQHQWTEFTGESPSALRGPRLPVNHVSFDLADAVLQRFGFTLPSEAQWEYACRAGTQTAWPTGDSYVSLFTERGANIQDRAWCEAYASLVQVRMEFSDGYVEMAPVGSLRANGFGLHDMIGNVWEWCADEFDRKAYHAVGDRLGDDRPYLGGGGPNADGNRDWRSIRGAAWDDLPGRARSSDRWYRLRQAASAQVGVRPIRRLR